MNGAVLIGSDDEPPERTDPIEVIEEHRDLFERIADTDLNSAEYCQRALDYADEGKETNNVE